MSCVNELDVDKLELIPIDPERLSNVADNDVAKKIDIDISSSSCRNRC